MTNKERILFLQIENLSAIIRRMFRYADKGNYCQCYKIVELYEKSKHLLSEQAVVRTFYRKRI